MSLSLRISAYIHTYVHTYIHVCIQTWAVNLMDESESTVILQVKGDRVYSKLKYEAGVHRCVYLGVFVCMF